MKLMFCAAMGAALLALSSCSSSKDAAASAPQLAQMGNGVGPALPPPGVGGYKFMPQAVAYKTNGDYRDNVPVTVSPSGKIVSYPAPSDIRPNELPIPLTNGWLLDNRGISANTVFTRYTYAQYAALPQAPTPSELKVAIIPGSRVTSIARLPMTLSAALADPSAARQALRSIE